jgi:hypothetical protein
MFSQKPLKAVMGLLSLVYNQAVIPLNTSEEGFLRKRQYSSSLENRLFVIDRSGKALILEVVVT